MQVLIYFLLHGIFKKTILPFMGGNTVQKLFTLITAIVVSINISVFAQTNEVKLLAIDLTDPVKLDRIELLNFPVVNITSDKLYTAATESQLENLNKYKIGYELFSDYVNYENLYILSEKKNRKINEAMLETSEHVKLGDISLIITDDTSINYNDLKIIPVKNISRTFKNIKTRYNSTYSNSKLDSVIIPIINDVNVESVTNYIQGLQDFGTRFLRHPNRKEVALWIKEKFELMGYSDVVLDSFVISGYMQYNVIATYPAEVPTSKTIVVGGHHDSITQQSLSNTFAPAPGADDNASGTTAVLESARVLMMNNFQSEANIKFVTFAAEELGLYGSHFYAQKALDSGADIKLMINHDMISSSRRPLAESVVDINYYRGSEVYKDIAIQSVNKYTVSRANQGQSNSSGSDSYSFWSRGFDAVYFEENDFSSYYHTAEDLIENHDMEFCTEVIKGSVATLISVSLIPAVISNFEIFDAGDGETIVLNWNPSSESNFDHYKVYLGTSEGNYSNAYETTNSNYVITGLSEGVVYYIGVSVVDTDGYESFILERTKIPYSVPLTPAQLSVEPAWHSVVLNWKENEELDLAGYNVYRSEKESEEITKLNNELVTENTFTDNTAESGIYYNYFISAEDLDQNESEYSAKIVSRAVTLDQGILLVDETADGDGSLFAPTDEQVDDFYRNAISDFDYSAFDLKSAAKINLSDLGAHSAVLWYGDDKTDQNALQFTEDIKKYLEFGGKFFYSGYRPSKTFAGVMGLTHEFTEGDFLYDYFKIKNVNYSLLARFNGAEGKAPGYPNIFTDQNKTEASNNYHINGIETFEYVQGAEEIYKYNSGYDISTPQGSLSGKTVGIEYIGEDFSTVVLSFPLYYMNESEAYEFINYVFAEKFGLITSIETDETDKIPLTFSLQQNFPNPFNPSTNIEFSLPQNQKVTLKVYDILGRLVSTLVDRELNAGNHKVTFNASNISSGVYFYTINAGEFNATKKLILLR
ncbi:hypothetical protein ASZ90_004547 [hydrocarbon metagenome]|uniref:Fibronectin type-III domain-containing protein n=1 Tax=hydrocarbon metagenome TaxID=938273 RepID=A0A0W8FXH7_9ZZZZ